MSRGKATTRCCLRPDARPRWVMDGRTARLACLSILAAIMVWGIGEVLFVNGDGISQPNVAYAQDGAVNELKGKPFLSYITDGGWIGVVICLCSVAGIALSITFAIQLRRDALVPPDVLELVDVSFEEENYDEAYQVCENNPSFFSAILAAGLAKIDMGFEEMEKSVIETGEIESAKLQQKVGWLSLIASVAPMLGLFGTVSGMIGTFNVIAQSQSTPKPDQLAGGISQALVTTFLGLLVAIPMTVLFVVFRNKVASIVMEVGALTDELLIRFKR